MMRRFGSANSTYPRSPSFVLFVSDLGRIALVVVDDRGVLQLRQVRGHVLEGCRAAVHARQDFFQRLGVTPALRRVRKAPLNCSRKSGSMRKRSRSGERHVSFSFSCSESTIGSRRTTVFCDRRALSAVPPHGSPVAVRERCSARRRRSNMRCCRAKWISSPRTGFRLIFEPLARSQKNKHQDDCHHDVVLNTSAREVPEYEALEPVHRSFQFTRWDLKADGFSRLA